jgi:hypothetical protein
MLKAARWVLAVGTVLVASPWLAAGADEKDEMVPNPLYKHWANCKPGSTATLVEKTALGAEAKDQVPDGVELKAVTYKLLSVTPKQVVVQVVVREREFLGEVEAAPTKMIYRPQIKRSHLMAAFSEFAIDTKRGEEAVTAAGTKIACKTLAGSQKKDDSVIEQKLWYSDKVPGGVVKRHRVARRGGKVTAETTIELRLFKHAE